ncbi:uncharacterized protein CANTADRAFT_302547 [Suhomyces tanzawaensis NRRL Y-17324]|uniref:Reticulon-like protein n=1 Tax=Suhomyces tanzawaensis NRRL Y-17324 TaxID=984487 RepID=A0A1E4SCK9_9ASCO|nr:uncharacterized protein CANTADRAFT_302547 [Suhomyces tanzawaensis NRRL Y-17324]ODV77251.1 hypothetical protein CANTADRAFT_302547 [Suhomyces tanzawaensis NRRL Y-17324]
MSAPSVTADHQDVLSLLTWKDPVKTGKVFGGVVAGLLIFKTINLFNIFFHLAYIGLLLSAAAEYAGKLVTGQGFVTKYKPAVKSHAKHFNDEFLPLVAEFNLKAEQEYQKIVFAHDIETTLKAAGVSYVLFKVTSWFSLFTLITTAVVLLFTVPAFYVHNKKQIDALVAQYSQIAREKTSEYSKCAQSKASPYVNDLIKKTGPVGNFISSKFPTRTAGSTVGDSRATSFGTDADASIHAKKVEEEISTATSTGATKFPEVPAASLNAYTKKGLLTGSFNSLQ